MATIGVDRELAGVEADTIVVDNREAARTLVTHLIDVGHRQIAALRETRREFD
jgi:DNA-binding LacI/PurR family transcriptional regulator